MGALGRGCTVLYCTYIFEGRVEREGKREGEGGGGVTVSSYVKDGISKPPPPILILKKKKEKKKRKEKAEM